MHFRTSIMTSLTLLVASSLSATAFAAPGNGKIIIANSNVTDPAAKKIVRAVTNESLKTISTKDVVQDAIEDDGRPVVEKLEDSEFSLPAKVVTEDAPGIRVPAAEGAATGTATDKKSATPAKGDESVPAEKALQYLQNGNKRYLKKSNRTDGKSQADRDRLKRTEKPHAVVLSCSDSRVPPETVFDQALGEIFVVRTAGQSLDTTVIASLEYAVEQLGSKLLVVMGHTSCGAVSAAVAANEDKSAGSEALDLLVSDIKPRLPGGSSRTPAGAPSESLEIESSANAQGVAVDLMKRSSVIRSRVEKGELVIKPALYYMDTGSVKFY